MDINLAALFQTEVVKIWFWSYSIVLDEQINKLHGTISQVTGDNLWIHVILAFLDSFNRQHFYNLHLVEKHDAHKVDSEDDSKIILT